jgi:hypothetical protein
MVITIKNPRLSSSIQSLNGSQEILLTIRFRPPIDTARTKHRKTSPSQFPEIKTTGEPATPYMKPANQKLSKPNKKSQYVVNEAKSRRKNASNRPKFKRLRAGLHKNTTPIVAIVEQPKSRSLVLKPFIPPRRYRIELMPDKIKIIKLALLYRLS